MHTKRLLRETSSGLIRAVLPLAVLLGLCSCRPPLSALEAEDLMKIGDHAGAARKVSQGLAQQPSSRVLWGLRVRIAVAQDRTPEAVAAYRARVAAHGEDEGLLRELSVALLEWGLRNRDSEVRLAAVQAARDTDAPELESGVAERLNDPDEVVRTWAAVALSQTPAGVDALARALRSSNAKARAVAAGNLGRIAGGAAIATLAGFVGDGAEDVRSATAWSLAATRQKEALSPLMKLLEDRSPRVRADAAAASGSLGNRDAAAPLHKLTGDAVVPVRLAAASALADLGDRAARGALRELAASPDLAVALRAGLRLAKLGEVQPVLDAVAQGLVDRRWTLRAAACNTAGSVKDSVAHDLVLKGLEDPEPSVRLAAARAVFAHRGQGSQPALQTAASVSQLACPGKDPSLAMTSLCVQSAELLLRAGNARGRSLLHELARRASVPSLRLEALRAALTFDGERAVAVEAMADPDGKVALAAAAWIYRRLR